MCTESHANLAGIILDKRVETTNTAHGIQTKYEIGTSGEVQITQHACEEGHQIIHLLIQTDTTYNVHILLKAAIFSHEDHHQAHLQKS